MDVPSGPKPVADSLAVNAQRLGADRAGKRLRQVTIGLGMMAASCVAYAVDNLSVTLPITPDAGEASLGEVLVDFQDRYGLKVSVADKRWESLPITVRSDEATFDGALRDLLRGYSYYLVRHDQRHSTLNFLTPIRRRSDNSEVQSAMIERGQAHNEAVLPDKGDWLEIWNEDPAEVDYVRAADVDADEFDVSEWVELRSTNGEVDWVRPEDLE